MSTQPYTLDLSNLRDGGDSGLAVRRMDRHQTSQPHDHVFHEIVYVESGSASHETAEGFHPLRPGHIVIIRPGVWHAYHQTRALTIYNVLFETLWLRRFRDMLARAEGALDLFWRRPRRDEGPVLLHARPAQRQVIQQQLTSMLREQTQREPGWQVAAAAALLDMLVTVLRIHRNAAGPEPVILGDRAERAVLEVVTHLEAHFKDAVTLKQLARVASLSPAHLSRCFKRRMGMGVIEFQHRLRAEEACRLLRFSDAPVSRIAGQLGYQEVAYFSRCFRKQFGMSASDYRARQHVHQVGGHASD